MTSTGQPGTRKLGNRKEKISLLQEVTLRTVVSSSLGFRASVASAALTGYSLAALAAFALCRHAPCRFLYAFTFEEKRQLPLSHACEVFLPWKKLADSVELPRHCSQRAHHGSKMATQLSQLFLAIYRSTLRLFPSTNVVCRTTFTAAMAIPSTCFAADRFAQSLCNADKCTTQAGAKRSPRLQRDSKRECI